MVKINIYLISIFVYMVGGANILIFTTIPLKSQLNVMDTIVKIIAPYHNITYIRGDNPTKLHPNIKIISTDIKNHVAEEPEETLLKVACSRAPYEQVYDLAFGNRRNISQRTINVKQIQQLLNTTDEYHLIIALNIFTEHFFPFAHKFKAPIIQVSTSYLFPWTNEAIGNINMLSTDQSFYTPEGPDKLIDRLKKFVKNLYIMYIYKYVYIANMNSVAKDFFPAEYPTPEEMNKRTDLLFVNTHPALGHTRYNNPLAISVGGLNCKLAKQLPLNLEEFISSSGNHGFIYLSLGGTFPNSVILKEKLPIILNVFKQLPQKFILKWENDIYNLPPNVRTYKWLPQQDLLGHNQIKLFITQGGSISIQEAVYHAVPVIVLPIIVDQHTNAFLVQKLNYGRVLSVCKFTESELLETIQEIISNPIYKQNIQKMSLAFRDQETSHSERVKYWVEYVLRHNGTKHLRHFTENYNWMYTIETDILLTLILLFVFVCAILMIISVLVIRYLKKILKIPFKQKTL